MPQIKLEYSNNILEKNNLKELFKNIHKILVEKLPTELSSCKSRAEEYDVFLIKDEDPLNAFIHLQIKVLKGRTAEILDGTGQSISNLLKKHFEESAKILNLQISLEITELSNFYYKFNL